jgi:hypothetical protein
LRSDVRWATIWLIVPDMNVQYRLADGLAPQAAGSQPQKKTVRTIAILDGLFSVGSCDL